MNDNHAGIRSTISSDTGFWNPQVNPQRLIWLRGTMALSAGFYFLSALTDAALWVGDEGLLSRQSIGDFLSAADLQSEARYYLSPLWWFDSAAAYRVFLIAGITLSLGVVSGRVPRLTTWVLWFWIVAAANRLMMLAGMTETLLSLAMFSLAIATSTKRVSWWTGFGTRLFVCQFTIVAAVFAAGTLNGDVWWNGLGAVALAEPAGLKSIDWTEGLLTTTWVHDVLTFLIAFSLPAGILAAWHNATRKAGVAVLIAWSFAVALLGSQWLECLIFAGSATSFFCLRKPV